MDLRKIVFLDVDGVLNSNRSAKSFAIEGHAMDIDPMKNGWGGFFSEDEDCVHEYILWQQNSVDYLRTIIEKTAADIVVSSTWRRDHNTERFKKMFSVYGWDDAPVVDSTGFTFSYRPRGYEIKSWINDNKEFISRYVILDDDESGMEVHKGKVVQTNEDVGLTIADMEQAIEILNK